VNDVLIAVSKNLLRENKQKHTITSTNDVKQWNRKEGNKTHVLEISSNR
jgi:hypothetical protein